jgi:hypothetical protein
LPGNSSFFLFFARSGADTPACAKRPSPTSISQLAPASVIQLELGNGSSAQRVPRIPARMLYAVFE